MTNRVRTLRRTFRYLKQGVFPPESIDEFTLGRTSELAIIDKQLQEVVSGASRYLFVEGTYGKGKSHMLKAIEALALRNGLAVCWVTLDGRNHACNHPTRYFHSLLESLRVPDSPNRGLASLLKFWLRSAKANAIVTWARQSSSWLQYPILALQKNPDKLEELPFITSWIESRDLAIKNGKPWFETISQRMQATAGLLRVAGYSGVVYLFDELETVWSPSTINSPAPAIV